jgi:hypothetical protein
MDHTTRGRFCSQAKADGFRLSSSHSNPQAEGWAASWRVRRPTGLLVSFRDLRQLRSPCTRAVPVKCVIAKFFNSTIFQFSCSRNLMHPETQNARSGLRKRIRSPHAGVPLYPYPDMQWLATGTATNDRGHHGDRDSGSDPTTEGTRHALFGCLQPLKALEIRVRSGGARRGAWKPYHREVASLIEMLRTERVMIQGDTSLNVSSDLQRH